MTGQDRRSVTMRQPSAGSRAVLVSFCALVAVAGFLQHPQAARQQGAAAGPRSSGSPATTPAPAPAPATAGAAAPGVSSAALPPDAVFNKYCVGCHNSKVKTAGLAL